MKSEWKVTSNVINGKTGRGMSKVLASYRGTVKGLRPYLLSLMYAIVVSFEHKKKTTSAKVTRVKNTNNVVSFIIPESKEDDNEIK